MQQCHHLVEALHQHCTMLGRPQLLLISEKCSLDISCRIGSWKWSKVSPSDPDQQSPAQNSGPVIICPTVLEEETIFERALIMIGISWVSPFVADLHQRRFLMVSVCMNIRFKEVISSSTFSLSISFSSFLCVFAQWDPPLSSPWSCLSDAWGDQDKPQALAAEYHSWPELSVVKSNNGVNISPSTFLLFY